MSDMLTTDDIQDDLHALYEVRSMIKADILAQQAELSELEDELLENATEILRLENLLMETGVGG